MFLICLVFSSDILRMDSTNADALYVRGLCLYYEDCIDKAVQFFIQALRMAPDHEKARLACRVSICLLTSTISTTTAFVCISFNSFLSLTECQSAESKERRGKPNVQELQL